MLNDLKVFALKSLQNIINNFLGNHKSHDYKKRVINFFEPTKTWMYYVTKDTVLTIIFGFLLWNSVTVSDENYVFTRQFPPLIRANRENGIQKYWLLTTGTWDWYLLQVIENNLEEADFKGVQNACWLLLCFYGTHSYISNFVA